MELILISCSNKKEPGGEDFKNFPSINRYLSRKSIDSLLQSRRHIANVLQLPLGLDVGEKNIDLIEYLPAYKRYIGTIYQRSGFVSTYPLLTNHKVLIVSAFYGVVEAGDWIRDYDLHMGERLADLGSVWQFWETKHLGETVSEAILELQPSVVHDLLPNQYRKALSPWPPVMCEPNHIEFKMYNYPGMGMGSLWARGDKLKELFSFEDTQ